MSKKDSLIFIEQIYTRNLQKIIELQEKYQKEMLKTHNIETKTSAYLVGHIECLKDLNYEINSVYKIKEIENE